MMDMEDNIVAPIVDGRLTTIRFGLATHDEVCTSSVSGCPISHPSQLTNPFLGLPLESGKCESCGTAEPGKCDGHFGYIQLPVPVYHPSHVSELKKLLSLICMKCLRMKKAKKSQKLYTKSLASSSLKVEPYGIHGYPSSVHIMEPESQWGNGEAY